MTTNNTLYSFRQLLSQGLYPKEGDQIVLRGVSKILIPMIQRPYAQGRKSQESIRTKFLQDIFSAIARKEVEKLELNFLYGTFVCQDGDNNVFELLDGQQRMTTLFLLHWYIANRERETDGFSFPDYLNKFQYQTRTTTTDFLAKLIPSAITTDKLPSKAIREKGWYSRSFDKDTTIDSMLRMLDSIHLYYQQQEAKPNYSDLDKLQFYVLELNGFGLTEELFIKMNARGLQLTPFENFKADLIGYMKKSQKYTDKVKSSLSRMNRVVEYWLDFSSLMDGKWLDLFWIKPDGHEDSGSKVCDINFFRFIQRFFANKAIILADKSNKAKIRDDRFIQFFVNNIQVERHFGFDPYSDFLSKGYSQGIDLIRDLAQLLEFLSEPRLGEKLLAGLTAPWEKDRQWEPWGTEGKQSCDVGQRQMIVFSAMIEYVGKVRSIDEFSDKAYSAWMRFVHTMVQSTDITGIDNQITLTRMLREILDLSIEGEDFDAYMNPRRAIVEYNYSHRDNRYLAAEAEKAKQIINDEEWDTVFGDAEKNAFMQGSCMFYFEDGMSIERYKDRTSHVSLIFSENGVSSSLAKDYLLMRGVLCRNYDWTSYRKDAYNITITNSGANRYLRNITIWNDAEGVKNLFCELLDCADVESIKNRLLEIIDEEHEVLVKDSYWSEQDNTNLNKVYKRLFKEKEMQPMKWLYELGEKSMGVYFYRNGKATLYKGNVNCMFLGSDRHIFISSIVVHFKDSLNFIFEDNRQNINFEKYGNYTGTAVNILSSLGYLPNNLIIKLVFLPNGPFSLCVNNREWANSLYNGYYEKYGESISKDHEGKNLMNSEGTLNSWYERGQEYFRTAYFSNFGHFTKDEYISIVQEAIDVIAKRY